MSNPESSEPNRTGQGFPANPRTRQVVGVGLVTLIVVFVGLQSSSLRVSVIKQPEGNLYLASNPWLMCIACGVLGVVAGTLAVLYWMRSRAFLFRMAAVVLALVAVVSLLFAPTGMNHRLLVRPNSFDLRIGFWFAPKQTHIDFRTLASLDLQRLSNGQYELIVTRNDRNEIRLPFGNLLKKALLQIVQNARDKGVVIGDGVLDARD